ncbi:MAG: hypothetical protein GY730_11590 [bacterium]|nr:hypothetical protein [bacterium]
MKKFKIVALKPIFEINDTESIQETPLYMFTHKFDDYSDNLKLNPQNENKIYEKIETMSGIKLEKDLAEYIKSFTSENKKKKQSDVLALINILNRRDMEDIYQCNKKIIMLFTEVDDHLNKLVNFIKKKRLGPLTQPVFINAVVSFIDTFCIENSRLTYSQKLFLATKFNTSGISSVKTKALEKLLKKKIGSGIKYNILRKKNFPAKKLHWFKSNDALINVNDNERSKDVYIKKLLDLLKEFSEYKDESFSTDEFDNFADKTHNWTHSDIEKVLPVLEEMVNFLEESYKLSLIKADSDKFDPFGKAVCWFFLSKCLRNPSVHSNQIEEILRFQLRLFPVLFAGDRYGSYSSRFKKALYDRNLYIRDYNIDWSQTFLPGKGTHVEKIENLLADYIKKIEGKAEKGIPGDELMAEFNKRKKAGLGQGSLLLGDKAKQDKLLGEVQAEFFKRNNVGSEKYVEGLCKMLIRFRQNRSDRASLPAHNSKWSAVDLDFVISKIDELITKTNEMDEFKKITADSKKYPVLAKCISRLLIDKCLRNTIMPVEMKKDIVRKLHELFPALLSENDNGKYASKIKSAARKNGVSLLRYDIKDSD